MWDRTQFPQHDLMVSAMNAVLDVLINHQALASSHKLLTSYKTRTK